jgi:hypothetical protein
MKILYTRNSMKEEGKGNIYFFPVLESLVATPRFNLGVAYIET